jgi:hypothetical protein
MEILNALQPSLRHAFEVQHILMIAFFAPSAEYKVCFFGQDVLVRGHCLPSY